MKRYDCLRVIAPHFVEELVVTNIGAVRHEWQALRPHAGNYHLQNLGLTSSLALGLALALPQTFGAVKVGPITLSLYWTLFGMTLAVVGLQSFFLGCIVQVMYNYAPKVTSRWVELFSYTRAMIVSAALALTVSGRDFARGVTHPATDPGQLAAGNPARSCTATPPTGPHPPSPARPPFTPAATHPPASSSP